MSIMLSGRGRPLGSGLMYPAGPDSIGAASGFAGGLDFGSM